MSMPGTILSQLGMQTMPSKQWARDHRLDAVGDQLAAGQRVLHADVAHGDAVVDADGVELEGHAAGRAHGLLDDASDLLQVDVAGDDVGVGVADGDERLVEVGLGLDDAGAAEQGAVGRAFKAFLDLIGTHGQAFPDMESGWVRDGSYAILRALTSDVRRGVRACTDVAGRAIVDEPIEAFRKRGSPGSLIPGA